MKKEMTILMVLAIACVANLSADAAVYVRGYYRSNGTYVQPHYRSNPDGNFYNNWSTYPNINPYTGAVGTKRTPSYSSSYSLSTPSYSSSYSWSAPSYSSVNTSSSHYFHSYSYPSLGTTYSTPSHYSFNSGSSLGNW